MIGEINMKATDKDSEKSLSNEGNKLWQILMEMDENNEHERIFSGSVDGPAFLHAIYGGRIQMGFENQISMNRQKEVL
jgi:hypothetical protein